VPTNTVTPPNPTASPDLDEEASDDSEWTPEDIAKNRAILLQHVRVNSIADYYDIQPLAKLSATKIKTRLTSNWHTETFVDILGETLETSGDKTLGNILTTMAAMRIEEVIEVPQFFKLDGITGFPAFLLLKIASVRKSEKELAQKKDEEIEKLKHELDKEKARMSGSNGLIQELEWKRQAVTAVDNCHFALWQNERCQECETYFGCIIDKEDLVGEVGGPPSYTLTCRACGSAHWYNPPRRWRS
jgi:hypothetical protein